MVKIIEPQAFDAELNSHEMPLLVAFLKRNERYGSQARILRQICLENRMIRCYVYDSDYLDMALERFSVEGTPTFLFFDHGVEVGRLIGETDTDTLNEFVSGSISR